MSVFNPVSLGLNVFPELRGSGYEVTLTNPDGSTVSGRFNLPALKEQLGNLAPLYVSERPEEYGRLLFSALFSTPGLVAGFSKAAGFAGQRGLRLSLELDENSPELWSIPWERLYQPSGNDWCPLCASSQVAFSRFLRSGPTWTIPNITGKLRVLVALANPYSEGDAYYFDINNEREAVKRIYDSHSEQVQVEYLDRILSSPVNPQALKQKLCDGSGFDILHYIGHGIWDEDEQVPYLLMEQMEDGSIEPLEVSSREFLVEMQTVPKPALCLLSVCNSSMPTTAKSFMGIGPELIKSGWPAVICMQDEIKVEAALRYSEHFYHSFLNHGVVDWAACQARELMQKDFNWQWSVPVLFMRQEHGIVFIPKERFRPRERDPYKFLSSFSAQDHDLFNGRAKEINKIINSIHTHPLSVVYGEAGVGLTSLLEAGVRPKLEQEGALVIHLSEYSDLVGEFYRQLQEKGRPIQITLSPEASLADIFQALSGKYSEFILFFDQFERAFLLEEDQLEHVIDAAQNSLQRLANLHIVIALDEDQRDSLAALQEKLPLLHDSWIRVEPLDNTGAFEAIWEPLRSLDWPVTISRELANGQIIADLDQVYRYRNGAKRKEITVDPGQLQITCHWLYNRAICDDHQIDNELYVEEGGGVEGIMARHLNEELETHLADVAGPAKKILAALSAPENEDGINGADFNLLGEDAGKVQMTLERLEKAELIICRKRAGGNYYSFANASVKREARILGGELTDRGSQAADELERIWRSWLAAVGRRKEDPTAPDRALPTAEQLEYLAEFHELIRPVPSLDRVMMLLRASILRNSPPQPWITWLDALEKETSTLKLLDASDWDDAQKITGDSMLWRVKLLLGLYYLQPIPEAQVSSNGPGLTGWAAARSDDPVTAQTAAIACTLIRSEVGSPVERLEQALESLDSPAKRQQRRPLLFGFLEDSGRLPAGYLRKKHPSHRLSIYTWRVKRRIRHDRNRIELALLGCMAFTGIGLGLLRTIEGILYQLRPGGDSLFRLGRQFFLTFTFYGILLGLIMSAGIALAGPLLVKPILVAEKHQSEDRHHNILKMILGALGFAFAALLLTWLIGWNLKAAYLLIPVILAAGASLSAALWKMPEKFPPLWPSLLRGGLVGGCFAFLQLIFFREPAGVTGMPYVMDMDFFSSYYGELIFVRYGIQPFIPAWPQILSLLDAFLTGAVLYFGMKKGLQWAAEKQIRHSPLPVRMENELGGE